MHSYKITENLFLIEEQIATEKVEIVQVPVNHIIVLDCSGSMSCELPKIREQLKNKLPKILGQDDSISIIWFSGRDEFGTLIEGEKISSLTDLNTLNKTIDRWLQPIGLTGFKQPLEEVGVLISKLKGVCSLFFMSDGCDNQWRKSEILDAIEKIADHISSATIVEYGYYADRNLLTQMAEKFGGSLIFSENFNKYEPVFENVLQKKISGRPRKQIQISNALNDFVYAITDEDIIAYKVDNNATSIPEDINAIWYLSKEEKCESQAINFDNNSLKNGSPVYNSLYAALSLFSVRMKSDVVYSILKCLGDVRLINQFGGCFGKQKYSEFIEMCKQATFGVDRFVEGRDINAIPQDDAFTVIELLNMLYEDDYNKVVLDSDLFVYNLIGRKTLDSSSMLTDDEQAKMTDIMNKMASTSDVAQTKKLMLEMNSIVESKKEPLKFVIDENDKINGYSLDALVFAEERPNISIMVRKNGTVDISDYIPEEFKDALPTEIKTFIYRNYAIIKDGIVNVDVLPVRLTKKTLAKLIKKIGMDVITHIEGNLYTLNLRALPVINRMMIRDVSAKSLCNKQYELIKLQAMQKVYNTYRKEWSDRKSVGFIDTFGEEISDWLKEIGITDYSGFAPKRVVAESTDFYLGKELNVKIKGLSTLPSVNDVKKRIASGKLTPSAALMADAIQEVETHISEFISKNENDEDVVDEVEKGEFIEWLESESFSVIKSVRKLIFELSQIKFAVIVGQIWFVEFESLEENTLDIEIDGVDLNCMIELKEVEVKI
jgi:hypothetical protein